MSRIESTPAISPPLDDDRGGGSRRGPSRRPPPPATSRARRRRGRSSGGRRRARCRGPGRCRSTSSMSRSVRMPGPGPLGVEHDRRADAALGHQPRGLAQRVARPDRQDHRAHPVTYLHADPPPPRPVRLQRLAQSTSHLTRVSSADAPNWRVTNRRHLIPRRVRHVSTMPHACNDPPPVRHRTSLFEEADRDRRGRVRLRSRARRHRPPRRLVAAPAPARLRRDRQHDLPRAPHGACAWSARPSCSAAAALTVREVAHRVGYRQPAQFAKAFRRHHGASPSAYRARSALDGFGDGSRIAAEPA